MRKFRSDSDGDYKYRNDAKTFSDEFYFINYIDKFDKFLFFIKHILNYLVKIFLFIS